MHTHEHPSDRARLTVITRAFVCESPIARSAAPQRPVHTVIRVVPPGATQPEEAVAHVGKLGKGLAWTLAIECAAALFVYAIWHVWHTFQSHG